MLFRRRVPEGRWARFRTFLWPRRSFRRSYRYFVKRVIRLDAAPHAVAAGFAAGVVASFTPFIGFHFLLAFAIAYLIAGNMAAAALGTAVGNPATFPFIWASTYEIGRFFTAGGPSNAPHPDALESSLSPSNLLAIWDPIVKPMLIGSVIVEGRSRPGADPSSRPARCWSNGWPRSADNRPAAPAHMPVRSRTKFNPGAVAARPPSG